MKRNFSGMSLKEVMLLLKQGNFMPWRIVVPPRPPGPFLTEALVRLEAFDTDNTEAAKLLLIDALFAEIVPNHPTLKVWKAMPLESNTLMGVTDYLISAKRAYLSLPLLCVAEAKRDDFVQGRAQCLAEMLACRWNNQQEGHDADIYGIVSNGQSWQFYKLCRTEEIWETEIYTMQFLPQLLGALEHVCAECAKNIP